MLSKYISLAFVFLSVSCTHNVAPKKNRKEINENKEPLDELESSVPMDLWSPDKRFSNALYYFFLGEFSSYEKNSENTFEYYQTAYNLDPNSFLAYKMILAGLYTEPKESMVLAKKMTLQYPEDSHLQSLFGQILMSQGFYDKAERKLKLSIDLDPKIKETYLNLIAIYQLQNKPEKAIEVCEQLLKYHPSYTEAYILENKLYIKLGKNKKALAAIKKAYKLDDSDAQIVLLYAYSLELNNKTKDSVRMYEKLLEVVPINVAITNNMVALYKELGNLDKSLALLERLDKKLDGKNKAVKLQIVFIYWDMHNYDKCISLLNEMIKKDPDSEKERYILGLCYEKVNKLDKAISSYDSVSPGSKFYHDAQYRVIVLDYRSGKKEKSFC